jgi:hypothetical protein
MGMDADGDCRSGKSPRNATVHTGQGQMPLAEAASGASAAVTPRRLLTMNGLIKRQGRCRSRVEWASWDAYDLLGALRGIPVCSPPR